MISACIVSYHSKDQIGPTLASLKNSELQGDFYVVDNASKDGSAQWVKENAPWVKVIESPVNKGFGAGNNMVIPHLKSRYHVLVNPDVTFEKDLLGRMVTYMESHPETVILTPRVLNEDGTEQFLPKKDISVHYLLGGRLEKLGGIFKKWRSEYTLRGENITTPRAVEFATGCFLMIRTDIFKQLKGFDERFFLYQEDSDLSRRARELGEITYHPDFTVTHAWARENTKTLKGNLRQIHSMFKYFHKWGWRW